LHKLKVNNLVKQSKMSSAMSSAQLRPGGFFSSWLLQNFEIMLHDSFKCSPSPICKWKDMLTKTSIKISIKKIVFEIKLEHLRSCIRFYRVRLSLPAALLFQRTIGEVIGHDFTHLLHFVWNCVHVSHSVFDTACLLCMCVCVLRN